MRGLDSSFTRFEVDGATEIDGLQYVSGRGLLDERFSEVLRFEPHGFASSPPLGSLGLALPMGGRRDQVAILGLEHPDHRPGGLQTGEGVLYDDQGQIVFLKRDGMLLHSRRDVFHAALGRLRVVMRENKYVQLKVKANDDPDDGGATVMHFTLDIDSGKIIMSQAPVIGPDPNPQD